MQCRDDPKMIMNAGACKGAGGRLQTTRIAKLPKTRQISLPSERVVLFQNPRPNASLPHCRTTELTLRKVDYALAVRAAAHLNDRMNATFEIQEDREGILDLGVRWHHHLRHRQPILLEVKALACLPFLLDVSLPRTAPRPRDLGSRSKRRVPARQSPTLPGRHGSSRRRSRGPNTGARTGRSSRDPDFSHREVSQAKRHWGTQTVHSSMRIPSIPTT
eukprot:scaffold69_cov248-Pinguiococcus_pyrenoidosus.AAC.3